MTPTAADLKVMNTFESPEPEVVPKTVKPIDYQKRNSTASMILNGTNALVSGVLGMVSLNSINKMKPELVPTAPVIEGAKMRDTGAQQFAAGRSSIVRSLSTARRDSLALGLTNLNPVYAAKDIEANNDLSGRIEGMRATIDQTNTQIENNVNQLNAGNKMNIANINANILNNFQSMKSQAGSQVINNTIENISSNVGGIAQTLMNTNQVAEYKRMQMLDDLKRLQMKAVDYSSLNNLEGSDMLERMYKKKYDEYVKIYGSNPDAQ